MFAVFESSCEAALEEVWNLAAYGGSNLMWLHSSFFPVWYMNTWDNLTDSSVGAWLTNCASELHRSITALQIPLDIFSPFWMVLLMKNIWCALQKHCWRMDQTIGSEKESCHSLFVQQMVLAPYRCCLCVEVEQWQPYKDYLSQLVSSWSHSLHFYSTMKSKIVPSVSLKK